MTSAPPRMADSIGRGLGCLGLTQSGQLSPTHPLGDATLCAWSRNFSATASTLALNRDLSGLRGLVDLHGAVRHGDKVRSRPWQSIPPWGTPSGPSTGLGALASYQEIERNQGDRATQRPPAQVCGPARRFGFGGRWGSVAVVLCEPARRSRVRLSHPGSPGGVRRTRLRPRSSPSGHVDGPGLHRSPRGQDHRR